jgi:predicted site-specific integrase-resolvase
MSEIVMSSKRVPLKEAAGILGVSAATLRTWTRMRRLSSYQICKKVMFSTEELERVIRESERPRLQNVA